MHGISSEAFDINSVIEEDVPIIAIVMEALKVGGVLQVLFEFHNYTLGICVVVYEQAGTCTEVDIGSYESLGTYNFSVTDRTLLFSVYFNSLSIPCMDAVRD